MDPGPHREAGCLVIDFRRSAPADIFTAYEELGVLCVDAAPACVLVTTGKEEPDIHYALRDALLTVAGVSADALLGMKVALVAGSEATHEVGEAMGPELVHVGCTLRTFGGENAALLWLQAGGESRAPKPEPTSRLPARASG